MAVQLSLVDQLLELALNRIETLLKLHRGRLAGGKLLLQDCDLLLSVGRPLRRCRSDQECGQYKGRNGDAQLRANHLKPPHIRNSNTLPEASLRADESIAPVNFAGAALVA